MGHGVTVVARRHDRKLPEAENYDGIHIRRYDLELAGGVRRLSNPFRQLWLTKGKFSECFASDDFDYAIVRDVYALYAAAASVPAERILYIQATAYPVFLRAAHQPKSATILKRLLRVVSLGLECAIVGYVERKCLRQVGGSVVLSNAKRMEISRFYSIPEHAFRVVRPGIDLSRYLVPTRVRKLEIRALLKLPQEAFIFLYVGRGSKEKNPAGLLRAFARLSTIRPVALILVGPERDVLKDLGSNPQFPGPVIFPGICLEPSNYYQASDAFVLPSLSEGFGQVLLEAMASGLPCLAYSSPSGSHALATSEVIEDGRSGLLADYDNEESLCSKLRILCENSDLAVSLGLRGRLLCEESYDWSRTTCELISILQSRRGLVSPAQVR